jgi:HK97 family phage prohead protease
MERKSFRLEIKNLGETGTFSGYANAFGTVDSYGDIVQPGAFKQTLSKWRGKGRPIPLLWHHDETRPIAVFESASEDGHGLAVEGRLLMDIPTAREARELLAAQALGGMSIGYSTVKSRKPKAEEEKTGATRILEELRLWEVSLVTFPANEDATVDAVKSLEMEVKTLREELEALRDGRAAGPQDTPESEPTHSEDAKAGESLRALLADMRDYTRRSHVRA